VVGSYAPTALSARARSSASGAEATDGMHAAWMAVDDMKIHNNKLDDKNNGLFTFSR
jgi:hypothetical protein